jgi:HAE1 family hydrophobic/amphiphilic exporter-1
VKRIIQWAVNNSPAVNTLMIASLFVGGWSLYSMRREAFPEFELEILLISVPYPGATPGEVETGICQKIEEAVYSIDGIKKQTSIAMEGAGHVVLELDERVDDIQRVLNEVRSEVDRIPSFPLHAEDAEVKQITLRQHAIRVGILGPKGEESSQSELELRAVTEKVREELLLLSSVSQANIQGARDYQIDIEIPESTLRKHGLTLKKVASIVRSQNVEMPGGTIKGKSQEVLLRSKNRRIVGEDIAQIPLVTQQDGVVLTIDDLGNVRDEFADGTAISRINGRPGLVISVDRTSKEDLLAIVKQVRQYIKDAEIPPGYDLKVWNDASIDVRDRMDLLSWNGLQGLALVFVMLAIFLNLRLAFWVALGIPVAILGACSVLLFTGATLNMLSMFAFLMALGIVVDDAIVIGENIYAHRQHGKDMIPAAIDGTLEVLPSVLASVCTTVIAFVPLMYVAGIMGKFIAVLPVAIIAMLIISLIESTFILPSHLSHGHHRFFWVLSVVLYPLRPLARFSGRVNESVSRLLDRWITKYYLPALDWAIHNKLLAVSAAAAILIATAGLVAGGITPWTIFPKDMDSRSIIANITFPDGTPVAVTDAATLRLTEIIKQIDAESRENGMPLVKIIHRSVGRTGGAEGPFGPESLGSGSHLGSVSVELVEPVDRTIKSKKIIERWREEAKDIVGTESKEFRSASVGPGGAPIEFKVLAAPEYMKELEEAVEQCKKQLNSYDGVRDVRDDSHPGKLELQPRVNSLAKAMGLTNSDISETVRGSFYGEEVMRLQRGRHEVKLMVRYPREERRSLSSLENLRIRTGDGSERPISELAIFKPERGYSEINRLNRLRSITITADIDEGKTTASAVVEQFERDLLTPLLKENPHLRVRWEGQKEKSHESVMSMVKGMAIALIAMFVLLTVEFRSYLQPLLIIAIIPFGAVGAIWGHAVMGLSLTMFTLFGFVALTGVIVNDAIVLIDFINKRLADGLPLREALLDAGRRRFRPVLLTSITTVAGLLPILTERSYQAQILIPMAATLSFGLLVATVMILILVPTFYAIYYRVAMGIGVEDDRVHATVMLPSLESHTDETISVEPLEDIVSAEMPMRLRESS